MDPGTPNRIEQMIEENHPTVGERQSARWHLALGPSYARRSHQKEEEWQEITVTAQAERDTVMAKALWDTTVGSYSIRKRAFSVVPDSSLPTSYDLHTDQDVVLSVRTERDLSVVPVGFSAWVTSTADVIQRVIAKLMGQLTTDQVQVVLDEGDARAVFRSLQVGTQIILIP